MKNLYLIAAVVGTIVPYFFFVQHFGTEGYSLGAFLGAAFATPAASGAFADLIISSVVFWVLLAQSGVAARNITVFVLLNLLIGLSCALPAYLWWRARGAEAGDASAA